MKVTEHERRARGPLRGRAPASANLPGTARIQNKAARRPPEKAKGKDMKVTRLLMTSSAKLAGEEGFEPSPLEPADAHQNLYQVRPQIFAPHLNGVQVVAGSNPATPTTGIPCLLGETIVHHHYSSRLIFCPHYYFRGGSLIIAFFPLTEGYLRLYTIMSTGGMIGVRR